MESAHGLRRTYQAGCRCLPCRAANAQYAAHVARTPNPAVDATAAREHLDTLSTAGVGLRRAGELAGLSWAFLYSVRSGRRLRVRAGTEAKILAIPVKPAPGIKVNSYATRHLLSCLLGEEFTLPDLAQRLGVRLGWLVDHAPKSPHPQRHISYGRAQRIKRFYNYIAAE